MKKEVIIALLKMLTTQLTGNGIVSHVAFNIADKYHEDIRHFYYMVNYSSQIEYFKPYEGLFDGMTAEDITEWILTLIYHEMVRKGLL